MTEKKKTTNKPVTHLTVLLNGLIALFLLKILFNLTLYIFHMLNNGYMFFLSGMTSFFLFSGDGPTVFQSIYIK